MFNKLAKLLLVSTALSPMLGAMAVSRIAAGHEWESWTPWLVAGIALACICWLMLKIVALNSPRTDIKIAEFERDDKEVLGFLLAYLLPVVSTDTAAFKVPWITAVYVFLILLLVFCHASALHFNPVLGMLGYHFYSVRDVDGRTLLLVSGSETHKRDETVKVAFVAPSIAVRIKEKA